MPLVAQGGLVTLRGNVAHSNGNPADAPDLTLDILTSGGASVAGFPVAIPPIVRDSLGAYHYVWSVPADLTLGDYTATWEGTVDGGSAGGSETVEVVAAGSIATDAYATVADFRETFDTSMGPPVTADPRIETKLIEGSSLLDAEIGFTDGFRRSAGSETRLYDGDGDRRLHVHSGIVSLTTVEIRSSAVAAWVTVPATDYVLEPYTPGTDQTYDHVTFTGVGTYTSWPRGVQTVRLTGIHGFPAVPRIVRRADIAYAREAYRLDASVSGGAVGPEQYGASLPRQLWPREFYDCVRHYQTLYIGCHV